MLPSAIELMGLMGLMGSNENTAASRRGLVHAAGLSVLGLAAVAFLDVHPAAAEPETVVRTAAEGTDIAFIRARATIAGAALLVFATGYWAKLGADRRLARARLTALCLLGLASYAGYYQFFTMSHTRGFARGDNFVYYVGSKYFAELGHDALYACSLVALESRGLWPRLPNRRVRDLRSLEPVPENRVRRAGADCPERFTPERWEAFGDDVAWFVLQWPPVYQHAVFLDHGYNATPTWSALGGLVAEGVDLDSEAAVWILGHADRVIVAATLVGVAWAFGLEVAALVAIVWGTGFLWRYVYVGDAMLRFLWWSAAMLGVCALRRGRPAAAGIGLAFASWLRLFPAALVLGVLVRIGRRWLATRTVDADTHRFVVALVAGGLAIGVLGLVLVGDGIAPFVSLADKLAAFEARVLPNKLGLSSVAAWLVPGSPALAGLLRWGGLAAFVALLWRALGRAEPWEAAALGGALIPMLSAPGSYYYGLLTIPLLLTATRPRIGAAMLLGAVVLNLNGIAHYRQGSEFGPAALVVVVVCFIAVAEIAFGRSSGRIPAPRPPVSA